MSEVIRDYNEFARWLSARGLKSLFVVCGNSFSGIAPGRFLDCLAAVGFRITYFRDFTPNPDHSSVVKGIEAFRESGADTIVGAGGGSAMDVAKAIKFEGELKVPFAAIPTTAGTGSEATRFAVIYDNGTKTSLTSDSMLPDVVLIDPSVFTCKPVLRFLISGSGEIAGISKPFRIQQIPVVKSMGIITADPVIHRVPDLMMDRPFLCVILRQINIEKSGMHGLNTIEPLSVHQNLIRQQEPQTDKIMSFRELGKELRRIDRKDIVHAPQQINIPTVSFQHLQKNRVSFRDHPELKFFRREDGDFIPHQDRHAIMGLQEGAQRFGVI